MVTRLVIFSQYFKENLKQKRFFECIVLSNYLAAAPIGDVVPADVTIEGVLLEHDLLGAVLADDEEGRVAVDHSGGRGVGQLHSGLAHIHADLVVEFGYNKKSFPR